MIKKDGRGLKTHREQRNVEAEFRNRLLREREKERKLT